MKFQFSIVVQYFNVFVDGFMSLAILFKYLFSFKLTITDSLITECFHY